MPIEVMKQKAAPSGAAVAGTSSLSSLPKSASSGGLTQKFKGLSVQKAAPKKSEDEQNAEDAIAWLHAEAFYLDPAERMLKIGQLMASSKNKLAIAKLVAVVEYYSFSSPEAVAVAEAIEKQTQQSEDVAMREHAMMLTDAILSKGEVGRGVEPIVLRLFPALLNFHADKTASIRDLAANLCVKYVKMCNPHSYRLLHPSIVAAIQKNWPDGSDVDWRVKVGALIVFRTIAPYVSEYISPMLPVLIPQISECILDAKKQVKDEGVECLIEVCKSITNDDIKPLVPMLVAVIAKPDEAAKTLDKLLETTFVVNVDAAVLALLAPLLGKILKSRSSMLKRKASKVIDIMCRLVAEPSHVAPFVPLLLPQLEKVIEEIVDQEVCSVAKEAREMLLKALGDGHAMQPDSSVLDVEYVPTMQANLRSSLESVLPAAIKALPVCAYIADMTGLLAIFHSTTHPQAKEFAADPNSADLLWRGLIAMTPPKEFASCVVPYLAQYLPSTNAELTDATEIVAARTAEAETICHSFRLAALGSVPDNKYDDDEDGTSLCNIEFSLAFGGKILLHNTRLRLGKGRRYGVMGKNGAGKTTLLTNVGSGNIEGMPPELKMIYVQHDDRSDDMGVPLIDELMTSEHLVQAKITKAEAEAALRKINFTETMLTSPRNNLSGGWKMKLLIIRAMLAKADVLLLDEPTNHLDAASVQWLIDFILEQNATCLIVSHDTKFMDAVLTDVIHYEGKKLVYYHGNLTHFVQIHPEAKYYYELDGNTLRFAFPNPERLDGINSNTRSIMKMENVTYTYPGASAPQLKNVSIKVCLGSRVAILGANGAGKSTLIKLLVRETEPDEGSGEVWKHMNVRLAYVAQHSFHHIEEHVDSSPVDYMKWRFAGGVDKEDMAKAHTKVTEEEAIEQKANLKYGDILAIHGRRKNGRTMEYDCSFHGQTVRDPNKYIAVEVLNERGYSKLVQQCDARVAAAAAGLAVRPLLTAEIQGHLDEFNLEAEFGTHGTIKRLSGGQKVKLVLAAAMWNRPHVIVLDEPTNYLDRQALGALTQAIKGFGGGVLIISHNKEFTDALCTEQWFVKDGMCMVDGSAEESAIKVTSARAVKAELKKSNSAPNDMDQLDKDSDKVKSEVKAGGGNTNNTIGSEFFLNPRSLEPLSKKEVRKLEKLAATAGKTMKEYVTAINCKSPEWKWL